MFICSFIHSFIQGDADLNSDFRVKENIDNTITLESVTCPGGVLGIDMKGQVGSRLSVNLVVRERKRLRERERDRQTDIQTDRQTDRDRE